MIKKDPGDRIAHTNGRIFTRAARVAFRHILTSICPSKESHVLLPSYIGVTDREGSGVLDPITDLGLRHGYFKLDDRLAPDLHDLEEQIRRHNTTALLLIHYFGIVQSDRAAITTMCKRHDVYLIEDCAHCMESSQKTSGVGDWGDFSIFSIHKMYPVPDGGILQINKALDLPPLKSTDRIPLDTLEAYSAANHEEIAALRIRNYKTLLKYVESIAGISILYPSIDEGTIPMNLPILLKSRDRYEVYNDLLSKKVETTALYYRLVDEITSDEFPVSHDISKRILNLPIHQDLTPTDLETIAKTLKSCL